MFEIIGLIVAGVVLVFLVFAVASSVVYIPNDKIGIVEKSGRGAGRYMPASSRCMAKPASSPTCCAAASICTRRSSTGCTARTW